MLHTIKICGIKDRPTLDACIDIGVGFIGFNFVPQSPRFISLDIADVLGRFVPQSIAKVALVVDATDAMINDIILNLAPDYLQLHGTETPERLIALKQTFNIPIIKAIGIATQSDIENARSYFQIADMMLFDAKATYLDTQKGGLGRKFDWSLMRNLTNLEKPFMLAGGLNHSNLHKARLQTQATYFDICSGVEISKGEKSINLIHELKQKYRFK
jgi:phosphoribosylanthranilate isomerase